MTPFAYARATGIADAVQSGAHKDARFLAGGTNLIDLMKENVERPSTVIDVNRIGLNTIDPLPEGGLRLGALVTNADTAYDAQVTEHYPLLASAILAGASAQLRNAATNGGNLNQRTRCYYFYDTATPCNKRAAGTGCGAIGGVNRIHAILGASQNCIATHPSDMCVALAVLNAEIRITGPAGDRVVPIADYHRLPGDEPWRDTVLGDGDLVTAIDLPKADFGQHHSYLKLRDRLSYAFALVSVAAAVRLENGRITEGRVALGGVASKPWRRVDAEALLVGKPPSQALFSEFAEALTQGAIGQGDNSFKIDLVRRAIMRALDQAANGTPQSQTDKRVA